MMIVLACFYYSQNSLVLNSLYTNLLDRQIQLQDLDASLIWYCVPIRMLYTTWLLHAVQY